MIEASDLSLRRGDRMVLEGVGLTLPVGRLGVVIGPNGAGKSSLVKVLTGELRPLSGRVRYGDAAIAGWSPVRLARRRAVLPQSAAIAFAFTVHEIVRLGAVAHGGRMPDRLAEAALARVGLAGFGGRFLRDLSGGEQQRVQFARALAQVGHPLEAPEGRLLFLDEPTSSLDLRHQIAVLEIARAFARAGGTALAVLHDLNLAADFADDLFVMRDGRLVAAGPPAETLTEAVIADVYGIAGTVGRLPPPGTPHVLPQARWRSAETTRAP